MIPIVTLLLAAIAIILLAILGLLAILFRWLWRMTRSEQIVLRALIVLMIPALLATPYVAYKTLDQRFLLARVPEPLEVAEVEYRLEELWGVGPGGNESGFIV